VKKASDNYSTIEDYYKDLEAVDTAYQQSDKARGSAKQEVATLFHQLHKYGGCYYCNNASNRRDAELVGMAVLRKEFSEQQQKQATEVQKVYSSNEV
jgi:hypothetical protein